MRFTVPLNALAKEDLPAAGGKAANLGELIRAGMKVPPGFTVTTEGYREFVAANRLDFEIRQALESARPDDPAALEESSREIRSRFQAGSIPPELAREIQREYATLSRVSAAVAVRSSATAEDLPDLSFAGQQDTYLNVVGSQALLDAVRSCWASLWTARAIGYRARNGIEHEGTALAVVVQRMVESEASGVLFTANPLTGERDQTVIDATVGLGEALVAGRVDPDHYVVQRGRIIDKRLGTKAVSVRGKNGGGTEIVSEPAGVVQALSDGQILELDRLGRLAERHFGSPQDMEWAGAGGQLFVVQSRPITSLYPLPEGAPHDELLALFSLGSVQGMLDPFTPFGMDGFRMMMAALGRIFGLRRTAETQRAMIEAGGRLFLNFTNLFRNKRGRAFLNIYLSAIDPGSRRAVESLLADPRLAALDRRMTPRTAFGFARTFLTIFSTVARTLIAPARGRLRLQRALEDFVCRVSADFAGAESLAARLAVMERMMGRIPSLFIGRLIPTVACGVAPFELLSAMCRDLPDAQRMVLELTRGLAHNVTTEMDLVLWETARCIQADSESLRLFASADAAALAAEYLGGKLPSEAQRVVSLFMDRYGMRGVAEIDMGRPRWREEPASLFQALKSYVLITDESRTPAAVFRRGAASAASAGQRLVEQLKLRPRGDARARRARWLIRRIRELTGLRESPKFAAVRAMTCCREALLATGRELAAQGAIESPNDIFFLRLTDLQAIAEGNRREWKALIVERKLHYLREKRRRMVPRVLLSDGTSFYEGVRAGDGQGLLGTSRKGGEADKAVDNGDGAGTGRGTASNAIVGSPVSPGVVEGAVRVVLDPSRAQLAPGEILVCPGTDPAWTPLFLAAGGLVMEVGGMMTHGSVVAREYGIPAVVGVSNATNRLATGQRIRVDGTTGRITVLS
jgi:phosphohistidine swiveling domain-containing protein